MSNERPNQAEAIEVILRARPEGMTASEIALTLVGEADGNRVRHNLDYLIQEGHVRRDDNSRPYRYYAVRL